METTTGYVLALFLLFPGAILVLGLISRVPLGIIASLLTIYYIVVLAVAVVGGLNWIAGALE